MRCAKLLMGKHHVKWLPGKNFGDSVIVVNAIHLHFPGSTWDTKVRGRVKSWSSWFVYTQVQPVQMERSPRGITLADHVR